MLVFDRFSTVFVPFWYQWRRIKIVLPLLVGAWISACVLALVPMKGLLNCYSVLCSAWSCFPAEECIIIAERVLHIYNAATVGLSNIRSIISLILYLSLFSKEWKLRNRIMIVDADGEEVRAAISQKLKQEREANISFSFLVFDWCFLSPNNLSVYWPKCYHNWGYTCMQFL